MSSRNSEIMSDIGRFKGIMLFFIFLFSSLFYGCASYRQVDVSELTLEEQRVTQIIVKTAKSLVGKNSLTVRGKKFNVDCTGGVLASYYAAGIDLWPLMAPYKGNGVKRLYNALEDKDLVTTGAWPVPGDIVFWDNTWDTNKNGRADDYLTHAGLIISSDEEGNIEYFHHHIKKGYVIEKMNLLNPDVDRKVVDGKTVIVNSWIRAAGLGKKPGWLASHLFRGFGRGWQTRYWFDAPAF